MAYRIDPPFHAVEAAATHSLVDRLPTEPEVQQLATSDHSVLARGNRRDPPVNGVLGAIAYHW